MAQNVLLKYGDTSVISGETVQQGKILIDTQKAEISIDKDGTTRLPLTPTVDSALSTTSTNPIANNAITNSIINTTAEVSAITADNIPCGTKPVKELITKLANGNITFSVVNNIPYVKVGADSARPFSGNAQKKDIVSGVTTYTFDRDVVGYSMRAVTGNKVYIDNCLNGEHLFGYFNKSNTSDRYISTSNNGYGIISGKTITDVNFTSGYIIAYFE